MHLYPMKRILVCTDFSESSDLAVKAAEELRKRNDGSIDLLHVSELGLHLGDLLPLSDKETYQDILLSSLKKNIDSKIQAQVSRCGVSCKPIIRDGQIDEVIVDIANEGNHDLIIMAHGRKPLIKQLLGSNASKVLSHSPLPLLLVKVPLRLEKVAALVDESREMDRVIVGTFDFHKNFKCGSVQFVSLWMDFPEPFGNATGGAHVLSRLNEQVEHFSPIGVKALTRAEPTRELKLAYPLEKILKEENVDIAVLKKFSEGNLKRIYIGSTTKRLLEIFKGNILILPP